MPHSSSKDIGIPIRDQSLLDPQQKRYINVYLNSNLNLFSYVICCTPISQFALLRNASELSIFYANRLYNGTVMIPDMKFKDLFDLDPSIKDDQYRYQPPRGNDGEPTWSLNGHGMPGGGNHHCTTFLCMCAVA